jgi:hypothetical protein
MPFLHKQVAMFNDQCPDPGQLVGAESNRTGKLNRVQPVFCDFVAMLDMDMWRLLILSAKKEETEPKSFEHLWHWNSLPATVLP